MVTFHVIFQESNGPVQQCELEAESYSDCEAKFQRAYPLATYWTVGANMDELLFAEAMESDNELS